MQATDGQSDLEARSGLRATPDSLQTQLLRLDKRQIQIFLAADPKQTRFLTTNCLEGVWTLSTDVDFHLRGLAVGVGEFDFSFLGCQFLNHMT